MPREQRSHVSRLRLSHVLPEIMEQTWRQEGEAVNVHDLGGQGLGRAVPDGIYDVTHNRGLVYVGGCPTKFCIANG
ncbi:MAG: hypothetical protein NVS2B16_24800 [Chloroflexota bacterium]